MKLSFLNNPIETIFIEATKYCNLKCKICHLAGLQKKGLLPGISSFSKKEGHLSYRLFEKIINDLLKFENYKNIRINLSGGEPFLNPQIFKILRHSQEYGLKIIIFTNGTCLKNEKDFQKIIKASPYMLIFPIDGSSSAHDTIRGNGNFKRVVNTILHLGKMKKNFKSENLKITVNVVINKLNVESFDKAIPLAQKLGCDMLFFTLVQWSDSLIIDTFIKESRERFGAYKGRARIIEGIDHKLGILNSREIEKVITKINLIKRRVQQDFGFPIFFVPDLMHSNEIKAWFSRGCYKIDYCSNAFSQIRMDYNGNVYPGCVISSALGNINKEPLEKILNGEKAKKFFNEIKTRGFFYICQRCCRRSPQSLILKNL